MARLPRWTCVLLLVGVAVMVMPGTAMAAVKSTVTITSGQGSKFSGKVTSPKQRCKAGRTVKLYREDDSGGEDSVVGSAKTTKTGAWAMDGSFIAGVFYARVLPAVFQVHGMALRCAGDFSVRQHF
jgi:hypothetical protein